MIRNQFGILIFCLSLFGALSSWAQTVGTVVSITGKVLARNETRSEGTRSLKPGDPLFVADILNTPSNGAAKLLMSDKSIVDLGASALFKVDEFQQQSNNSADRKVHLSLAYGKIRVVVNSPLNKKGKFSVKTRAAVMGVRGTEFVVLSDLESFIQPPAAPKQNSGEANKPTTSPSAKTQITVIHGKVEVDAESKSSSGETKKTSVALTEGTQLTTNDSTETSGDNKESSEPKVTKLSKEEVKEVQQESKQQDKTFTRAVSVDTANGGGEQTLADLADGFALPADFVPQISDMRLPGAFGLDLWVFNPTNILNTNSLQQSSISNLKVVFSQ